MNQENSSFGEPLPLNLFEEIQELKNSGATCDTFKVRLYGKWFFLKRLKQEFKTNPLYIASFEKEFDLGFHLDHPNIVNYHDKGSDQDGFYIITEYIDGLNLREYIIENPNCLKDKKLISKLVLQLLSALDYLHNNQIIHLDIKPENILITSKGKNIKLIDLGFSASDGYQAISCGTPNYSAPEQFNDPSIIDVTSDIFSFGSLLIYFFTGDTKADSIHKIPKPYQKIAKKCLQIKPSLRFKNIQEIINILESERKLKKNLMIVSSILILLIVYSLAFLFVIKNVQTAQNNEIAEKIQVDKKQLINLMDSALFQFDKEYPKIELSNLYDATRKYNLILANIYQWKQNHQLDMVLNQRPLFESEFTQVWNEKTKKYNEIFNRIQLSNHLEQSPVEEKIKKYIQESLSELFKPLNAYQVINKENAEESR
jgi:serine/threonine protein kinase